MIILIKIINILRKRDKYEQSYELKKIQTKSSNTSKITAILFMLFFYYIIHYILKNRILIEVDIYWAKYEGGGPVQLQKGISKVLPYKTKNVDSSQEMEYVQPEREKKLTIFSRLLPVCQKGLLKDGNFIKEPILFY